MATTYQSTVVSGQATLLGKSIDVWKKDSHLQRFCSYFLVVLIMANAIQLRCM